MYLTVLEKIMGSCGISVMPCLKQLSLSSSVFSSSKKRVPNEIEFYDPSLSNAIFED